MPVNRAGISDNLCRLCFRMAPYQFNLEDHYFLADRCVHDCIDEQHAREVADETADHLVQLQPELLSGGHAIVVRNELNIQIYLVPKWIETPSRQNWRCAPA